MTKYIVLLAAGLCLISCNSTKKTNKTVDQPTTGFPLADPAPSPNSIVCEIEVITVKESQSQFTAKVIQLLDRGMSAPTLSVDDELELSLPESSSVKTIEIGQVLKVSLESFMRMGEELPRWSIITIH